MEVINVEIKARCSNTDFVRTKLKGMGARYEGCDHQTDTYFKVSSGRLKIREGNIEQRLIFYLRPDASGPKVSNCKLFETKDLDSLKEIMKKSLGILAIVNKKREIYYFENVKFHIDSVDQLGSFIEIEASSPKKNASNTDLLTQCMHYISLFQIEEKDLIDCSYSDLLLKSKS